MGNREEIEVFKSCEESGAGGDAGEVGIMKMSTNNVLERNDSKKHGGEV